MKNRLTLFVGILILLVLLAKMFMFQVRYDQWAVVSTLGRTTEASVKREPGLYFRWPPPIQSVTEYSRLVQIMDNVAEELQTQDKQVIIVKTFLAWRIVDPQKFFEKVGRNIEQGQAKLRPLARGIPKVVLGGYKFSDMVNMDPDKVKLAQIEKIAREQLQEQVSRNAFGLEIEHLGIRRILVPEQVTQSVFQRMIGERQRLAQGAKSSGEAEARRITEEAQQISEQILSFAESVASTIRLEGDAEAARYLDPFAEDPSLANFLRWTETLGKILKHRTHFVLSTEQVLSPEYLLGANKHALVDPALADPHRAEH